jgi:hypothetical protein
MIESLQEAIQDQVSQHAPLSEWIETAQDERLWNHIIDEWYEVTCQVSFTDFELYNSNQCPDTHHRHTPSDKPPRTNNTPITIEKEFPQFILHQL